MLKIRILVISTLILITGCKTKDCNDTDVLLNYCLSKIHTTLNELGDEYNTPRFIPDGRTNWELSSPWNWTSGFWPGILWYVYEYTGDESIKKEAEKYTIPIRIVAENPAKNHDIGFMVYCSFGNGYRLTGSQDFRNIMIAAADTLATLYNPHVGTLHSWPSKTEYPHNTIIDNMMNLELLFWASKNGGNKDLYSIAERHAEVTMKHLVRSDSAVYHLGVFDDKTGEFLRGVTHQGYANESMWARGQAWGIYGFTMCYRETGRQDFLETAMMLADHFLNRLPEDGIPYWDFDDTSIPDAPKDASAAAIAASGLLELSGLVENNVLKAKYKDRAVDLLTTLSTDKYLSNDQNNAFLLHSVGHMPRGWEVDVPLIYADYYYIEALIRLKKIEEE